MAQLIRIDDNRGGYHQLVDFVMERGAKQPSRNGDTLEVNDMVIELADPTRAIPSGVGRKGYSNALAALEGLQLIAGRTYDDLMVEVAPATEQFREDDDLFHGAYGRRIGDQMRPIVERLKRDPATRQAVVTIWDPALDTEDGKRDYPCTCLFNWRVRNGQLLMSTFMRSQDVHWGWPYDVVMFTMLQLTMASYLGIEAGPYTHHAASFHIYTKDVPAFRTMHPFDGTDTRIGPIDTSGCATWEDVQSRAHSIVQTAAGRDDLELSTPSNEEAFYLNAIAKKLRP